MVMRHRYGSRSKEQWPRSARADFAYNPAPALDDLVSRPRRRSQTRESPGHTLIPEAIYREMAQATNRLRPLRLQRSGARGEMFRGNLATGKPLP